jgi:hypothetical protein
MNFIIPHVYREDNQYTDSLANMGLYLDNFTIWYIPHVIRD